MSVRRRWLIVALLIVGWASAPFWLIPNGIHSFDGAARQVAGEAHQAAWSHNDNPLGRLAFPAARVQRVWREPGHCRRGEPGGLEPFADWRAEVRFFSYFAIPGPVVHVRCGGWAWGGA